MDIKEYKEFRLNGLLEKHLNDKVFAVSKYLGTCGIKKVTVGFSGGADSTLVLLILVLVKIKYMPRLEINAVTIYSDDSRETSFNIDDVNSAYDNQSNWWWIGYVKKHLIKVPSNNRIDDLFPSEKYDVSHETIHQSYYQYMYNILYTHAQISGGITVGTTNLDEIAYVGWFGKNSDMVVDLQIISDLHKFEVNAILADYKCEIAAEPCGDMPDGHKDTDYFDMSYDELAHYSWCRCMGEDEFIDRNMVVDALHMKNRHKYFGQSFNPVFIRNPSRFFMYDFRQDIIK